jgi:MarR family transcriptional regulator, organic hydroperoxide resistance regulator
MTASRSDTLTSAVRAVHSIFRTVDTASRRLLKDFGVTGPQLWALRTIEASRGLTIGQLADRLYLHISTVSGILDRLEKSGWVERRRSDADRRVVRLAITRKGRALIGRAPEPPRSVVLRGLRLLDDRELAEMARSTARLLGILQGNGRP